MTPPIRHIGTAGIKPTQANRDEGKRLFPNDPGKARAYALIAAPMGTIAGVKPCRVTCGKVHPIWRTDQNAFDALETGPQVDFMHEMNREAM